MRRLKPFFPIALAALMGGGIAQNLFAEEIGLVSEQCTQQDGRPRARGCQENICPQVQTDPFMYFDADYLFWARDSSNATR
ncbi:MAG: hypothetical protein KDA78_05145, partial [Planctomycetaceae bacterium]|nr:hypothetical protein [Planctomycetaceae bacterium]